MTGYGLRTPVSTKLSLAAADSFSGDFVRGPVLVLKYVSCQAWKKTTKFTNLKTSRLVPSRRRDRRLVA